jgi:hypothetical protein
VEAQAEAQIRAIHEETAQKQIELQDKVKKAVADRIKFEIDAEESKKAAIEASIANLQDRQRSGDDVSAELKKEVEARQAADIQILENKKKASLEVEQDTEKRAQLEISYNAQIEAERQKAAVETRKVLEENARIEVQHQKDALDLARAEASERAAILAQAEKEGTVSRQQGIEQEKQAIADSIALRKQEIVVATEAAAVGKNAAEQARLRHLAELQINQAERDGQAAMQGVIDKYKEGNDQLSQTKSQLDEITSKIKALQKEQEEANKGFGTPYGPGGRSSFDIEDELYEAKKQKERLEQQAQQQQRNENRQAKTDLDSREHLPGLFAQDGGGGGGDFAGALQVLGDRIERAINKQSQDVLSAHRGRNDEPSDPPGYDHFFGQIGA